MSTVRDHFWLWGHVVGSRNPCGGQIEWNLPSSSRIPPAEAVHMLVTANLDIYTAEWLRRWITEVGDTEISLAIPSSDGVARRRSLEAL